MLESLTDDRDGAVPITLISKAALPAWIEDRSDARSWLSTVGFKADPGSFVFIPEGKRASAEVLAAPADGERLWSVAGLPMALPEGRYALALDGEASSASTNIALGWALGAYAFTRYRNPKRTPARLVWPGHADREEVERIAGSVYRVRDLVNTPAEDMGPAELAQAARAIADECGAEVSIIVGDELLQQNYPTIHLVGRASVRAPRLIDLRWGDPSAPKVTLVGKGVCFDTGGLDLKSHDGMLLMKKDMGGAAVVLGLARALMSARVPIRLRVLIPAVENSVAGNAVRPLDIVRTRSGKTVEIGNTDAEGRLILCDALFEADREHPDLLVDCATLTGAARVALGPELQALYCDDDKVASGLLQAGTDVGDPLWRMPLWRGYRKLIDGKCADLNNVSGGSHAGSIIAALYLAEFVSPKTRWAHLDIFATNATARPGRPEGAEATGMRALYAYLRKRYE